LTQILVDENVPRSVRKWLNKKGFTTTSVSDTNLKGAKDETIAKYAAKNNMTILTLDTDFAQIYHTLLKGTVTVVVIKAKPATPTNIIEILNAAQQKLNINEIQNKLVIITKKRIRIIS
jgi:predicted nuclease of predicted toxin-antitoxin system